MQIDRNSPANPHLGDNHRARVSPSIQKRAIQAALLLLCTLLLGLGTGQANGEGQELRALPGRHSSQPAPADPRFGVVESYESPADASELGVGWTRIIFHWARAQAGGPESWTPKTTDEQIAVDLAAGREVTGLLIGIPDWARDENRLPKGLWLAHDDPANSWANYVREVVTRYQGRISHWIIWNEPDIRETEIAHTWDGSVADFAQLVRVAYLAAKESNPDAVIHLAAFTYWADVFGGTEQYMARLLDEIMADPQASDHNYYFDIATSHLYFQPVQVYDLLIFFTDILRERGLEHPIWLVETNAPPRDDPEWPVPDWFLSVTLEEQAAFIPQALASAVAADVGRVAIYKLRDNEEDQFANPEPFGLVRFDGSHRPAFDTYRQAIEQLSGFVGGERERWDGVGQIRIDQPGKSTTVLFSRLPSQQTALVAATTESAIMVDMWGDSRVIEADDGQYEVALPAASCSQTIGDYCMIGGTTYYLVQSEASTPTPTTEATSTLTPVPTATTTPSPTNTPTNTPTITPAPSSTSTSTLIPTEVSTASLSETASPPPPMTIPASPTGFKEPSPTATEPALESTVAPGLWFLGGGILLAAVLFIYWINQRRK